MERGDVIDASKRSDKSRRNDSNETQAHTQELCNVGYEETGQGMSVVGDGKEASRWCRKRRGWKAASMSTESASPPGERQN